MKKTICKIEYDTETATLIKKFVCGFYGDPAGYEESLYQTAAGLYFLYVCGGENSPYPTEDILRLAKTKVNEWMENHYSIVFATYLEPVSSTQALFLDTHDMIEEDYDE